MRKTPKPKPRAVKRKISITIDAALLNAIDRANENRSDEINHILRRHFEQEVWA